jgi:tetratricopeptide (TPR) repeat protein|nr:hypothetical protein [Rhodoferax sp.]
MSLFAFIELPPPLDTWVSDPHELFPMRVQVAAELEQGDAPEPERILFELERYLVENPARLARYAEAGGQLAFRTAFELFSNGLREESLQFYALSLRLRPGDVATRLNYAIALHGLEYRSEALAEYNRVMGMTTPDTHFRVWVLAAQIHYLRGEYSDVVRLLRPLAETLFPQDAEYWDLLGEAITKGWKAPEAVQIAEAPGAIVGDFVFYELNAHLRDQFGLPPEPIPLRRESRERIFPEHGPVALLEMLREVEIFMQLNPDFLAVYAPLVCALAYLAGMAVAAEGDHAQALQIYAIGLAVEPDNIPLRSHSALSLHCLGQRSEARNELERVVAMTPKGTILPLAWMMLARICADEGNRARAIELLEQLESVAPGEKGVQKLLSSMQRRGQ